MQDQMAPRTPGMTKEAFEVLREHVIKNKFILIPPQQRNQSGSGEDDFLEMGLILLWNLVNQGFKPSDSVLDIGCGIGRMALPATQYLNQHGKYFGIDINLSAISWCHEYIHGRYENFEFAVIDAYNKHYLNRYEYGQNKLVETALPIPSNRIFDCICANSVFTHLLWEEVSFYFEKIPRILRPDGFFLCTWFLITDETTAGVESKRSLYDFDLTHSGPTYLLKDSKAYSGAIAQSFEEVVGLAHRLGLRLVSPPHFSGWHEGTPGQDILVFGRI